MVVAGRKKTIALFIALGIGLISVTLLLYVGWVLLNWRTGLLLVLGVLLMTMIIAGVVLNTIFLVREIRRNEQKDAFINAVTHELKTPVASIRLYLETLQTRSVDEDKRQEFYGIMLEDSNRLLSTIEQILRTGRVGASTRIVNLSPIDIDDVARECIDRARVLHNISPDALRYQPAPPVKVLGDPDEVRAAISNLIDNAVKYSGKDVKVTVEISQNDGHVLVRVKDEGRGSSEISAEADLQAILSRAQPADERREGYRAGPVHRPLGGQAPQGKGVGRERRAGPRQHLRPASCRLPNDSNSGGGR